jgi:hypothetical protein
MSPLITVSVVSHAQATLVAALLSDLDAHCAIPLTVILTLNIDEPLLFEPTRFKFPLQVIRNKTARGFGANHNAAFRLAQTDYFCVVNPDVRLSGDPFSPLLEALQGAALGVAAPKVLDPAGNIEDSARKFPTPFSILKRALFGSQEPDYTIDTSPIFPDWVGGMFMLLRGEAFRSVGGFDERYFLYYEDVDICWRMQQRGLGAVLVPTVHIIHHAQRRSHRDGRYFFWHVTSMLRFFARRALNG